MKDQKSNSPITTTKAGSPSQLSVVLALITLAQFMIVVDSTIVQVAFPSVGKEFSVSVNGLQWLVTAYGLTLGGFLMLSGRVGDIYGHKKLFIISSRYIWDNFSNSWANVISLFFKQRTEYWHKISSNNWASVIVSRRASCLSFDRVPF
jgi:MFS family permease